MDAHEASIVFTKYMKTLFLVKNGQCTVIKAVAILRVQWNAHFHLVGKSFAIDANNSLLFPTFHFYSWRCLIIDLV